MQSIRTLTENIRQNNQTPTSTRVTATSIIDSLAEKVLGTIIFRTRLAKGWNGYDERTQKLAVQTWFEILQTEKVPAEQYDALYRRACNYQAFIIQQGKEAPDMSAQLMLAQWIGGNGLRAELERERIESGKYLPSNAESVCKHCNGSGFREVIDGKYKGVKKCNHED